MNTRITVKRILVPVAELESNPSISVGETLVPGTPTLLSVFPFNDQTVQVMFASARYEKDASDLADELAPLADAAQQWIDALGVGDDEPEQIA